MKSLQFQSIKTVLEVKKPAEVLEKSLGPKEKFQEAVFKTASHQWENILNNMTMKKRSWTDFHKWLNIWLPFISDSALRVITIIAYQTIGYKKDWDWITKHQFREGQTGKDGVILNLGCGIKTDDALGKAFKELESLQAIKMERKPGGNYRFSLVYARPLKSYPHPTLFNGGGSPCSTGWGHPVQRGDINAYETKHIKQLAGQVKNQENQRAFYGGYPVISKGDRFYYEEDGVKKEFHGSREAFEWK